MPHYKVGLSDGSSMQFDSAQMLTKDQIQQVVTQHHPGPSGLKQAAAGIGRFGLETGGMIGGGALGGLTSEFTGPVGPIAGAGLGSAAGTALADKLNKALGVPVPPGSQAKRLGMSGLMGMGGEAAGQGLSALARTAPVQGFLARNAPKALKLMTDTPEEFTRLKLSEKTLPKATAAESTEHYAEALGKIGIRKDANAEIDKLAQSFGRVKTKGDVASLQAQGLLKNLAGKVPPSKLTQLMGATAVDVGGITSESVAKNANDLRVLQNITRNPDMVKQYGPRDLIKESLNLRHNLDAKINYQPSTGEEKALAKHYQGILKEMRSQTQRMIEALPGGDVVRAADKKMQLEMAGREFGKAFKPPRARSAGGIARWGGLGFAPYIISKLTGIPMPATYAAAILSRSPRALGALMTGIENPGTFSQPIYQALRLMRQQNANPAPQ